jgi:GNAT superfamily N-acetyltransferase
VEIPGHLRLSVEDEPEPSEVAALVEQVALFNEARAEPEDRRPLAVFLRDGEDIVGGASGFTHWHWLFVEYAWVRDDLRLHGTGSAVLAAIEDAGRSRGCRAAYLYTFGFQALAFYLKQGYRQFGQLTDFPPGNARHFLLKRL